MPILITKNVPTTAASMAVPSVYVHETGRGHAQSKKFEDSEAVSAKLGAH